MMNSAAERSETILNRIGEYSRRLGRVPASIYALGFAALILGFAVFYSFVAWLSPAHALWYGSQGDQQCSNDAITVQNGLNYELKAAYRASGQANQVINGWRMLSDRLEVSGVGPRFPDYMIFQLEVPFSNGIPEGPDNEVTVSEMVSVNTALAYFLGDMAYVTFSAENVRAYVAPVYGPPTILPAPGTPSPNETPAYPTGIPAPVGLPGATGDNVLPVSYDLYQMMVDVIRCQTCQAALCSARGIFSNGTYAQMLRLSALSASLRPLADATPASALAYVSSGSERILGAILLALILNSFAYDIAKTLRMGSGEGESDQASRTPAGKRPATRAAKGTRSAPAKKAAAGGARKATQASPTKRAWRTSIFSLAKRGCILAVAGAAVLLTLAVLYAAGIYLWSMAQYESSRPRPYVLPTLSASATATATPTATASPIATLTPAQTATPALQASSSPSTMLTPMHIDVPAIERNLVQNSGFEDGLAGWTYSDRVFGINVFETAGLEGRAFCSRRIPLDKSTFQKESAAFVQKVGPIDPTAKYFFSAWVKLHGAVHVYPMARMYDWSGHEIGWTLTSLHWIGGPPDGESTSGWVLIQGQISTVFPMSNYALVGIWHGAINDTQATVDSTICVDDLVFGKIAE